MTNMRPLSKTLPACALTALAILIAGCSSQPSAPTPVKSMPLPTTKPESTKTLEQRLIEANKASYPRRAELTLPVTRELLRTDPARAKYVLDQLPYNDLPAAVQANLALQQALIAEANNQSWEVFNWLDREPVITSEDRSLLSQAYVLRALAYARFGEHQAALDEWLTGIPMLSKGQRVQYYDVFWQSLLHVPAPRLQELYGQVLSEDMRGWIALALIYQPGDSPDNQLARLQGWKQNWPSHPANSYFPENFDRLRDSAMQRPKQVAVLLPLTGNLGTAGRSVRDGIIAANYEALSNNEDIPELQFYDTGTTDVNNQANQAIEAGAQLIIGPLTKSNVAKLQADTLARVPVLALNYLDDTSLLPTAAAPNTASGTIVTSYQPHLYQFGLSAEDEARMAARRGRLDGHQRAVVITPDTDWGKKISATFIQTWIGQGGEIASSSEFGPKAEFSKLAGDILQTNQSQTRANQLNRQLGSRLGFRPRRRQDVDMIFIGANPGEARQLKPALAYQFAGSIPVYATSSAFSGSINPVQDQDMDGIRIPVMPWLLPGAETRLEQQITQLWAQSRGQYGTLYALGADAYRLYPRLQQLSTLQGSQVHGLTGRLSMTTSGKVQRELTWQLFKNGRLVPLPVIREASEVASTEKNIYVLATKTP